MRSAAEEAKHRQTVSSTAGSSASWTGSKDISPPSTDAAHAPALPPTQASSDALSNVIPHTLNDRTIIKDSSLPKGRVMLLSASCCAGQDRG